jgi:hypothetical protein
MLMNRRSRPTVALVAVIVLATAAFGIGAALEKSEHHNEGSEGAALPGSVFTAASGGWDTMLVSGESSEAGGEAGDSGGETHTTEPSKPKKEAPSAAPKQHSERGEVGNETSGETSEAGHSEGGGESHSEDLLGIDPESTALVVLAIVGSLALAAAVWLLPEAIPLLALVGLAMLFFCALDIREAVHQSDESNTSLMALALVVASLHLVAGGLAIWLATAGQRKAGHAAA